jgi:hypothetical protein
MDALAAARRRDLGVLYIDHNLRHVLPVADRIIVWSAVAWLPTTWLAKSLRTISSVGSRGQPAKKMLLAIASVRLICVSDALYPGRSI